jgi:putative ABC transport system ATP-binding protein
MQGPSRSDHSMILLEDVHLTLASAAGAVNVLRGAALGVAAGETVSLVGPSGSGKSTLMMVIGGLERPDRGRVAVAGTDLAGLDEDALARFRRDTIGIVFQSFHLIPTMTALENVAVPLELAGRADAFAAARDGLAAVGLAERVLHYPGQLSGGEQQRVALARAFAAGPKLLLADEPTGNLDTATGRHVIDLLFELAAGRGTTLLLITHDRDLARRCDRILHMEDGRIVESEEAGGVALGGRG